MVTLHMQLDLYSLHIYICTAISLREVSCSFRVALCRLETQHTEWQPGNPNVRPQTLDIWALRVQTLGSKRLLGRWGVPTPCTLAYNPTPHGGFQKSHMLCLRGGAVCLKRHSPSWPNGLNFIMAYTLGPAHGSSEK